MDQRTRLSMAFDLQQPDRPPILGGWLAAPEHIQMLAGCTEDEYWDDPFGRTVAAEQALGSDGVIGIFTPVARGAYRCVDGHVLERRAGYTIERVLEEIDWLPQPDEMWAAFDEDNAYAQFAEGLRTSQAATGDVVWTPPDWDMIPCALWYARFGYENALMLPMLHPDAELKLLRWSAARGRQRAILQGRALREGLRPRAILTGEDLCSQRGPMISPAFLRKEYWPLVEYAIEPFLAAGGKLVWHCDGDVRPILPDVLAAGFHGLQGFQRECGMDIEWIAGLRSCRGEPLLIFGPMSVTRTLPHGTVDEVIAEARGAMDACRDRASLVYFTSNTITPDVPLANIRALWDTVRESRW